MKRAGVLGGVVAALLAAGCADSGPRAEDLADEACVSAGYGAGPSKQDSKSGLRLDASEPLEFFREAETHFRSSAELAAQAAVDEPAYTELVEELTTAENGAGAIVRLFETHGEPDTDDWPSWVNDQYGAELKDLKETSEHLTAICRIEAAR